MRRFPAEERRRGRSGSDPRSGLLGADPAVEITPNRRAGNRGVSVSPRFTERRPRLPAAARLDGGQRRRRWRRHSVVNRLPVPGGPIVRAHHENWDGSGYPNGLRGEDIPLGARILSVVDCFDALTSDRPYRAALSDAEALGIIAKERGTKYDPAVVDMFVQVHRDIAPPAAPAPPLQHALQRLRGATRSMSSERATIARFDPSPQQAEELLAFVSLARISSQTPTVGDIGALAWGHIRHIAPGSSLAIFVHDPKQNWLVAEFTAGPAARQLAGLLISMGQRLTGWVAANARSVINSDARIDLSGHEAAALVAMSIPLIHDGSNVGVMTLYRAEPFTLDQSRMLEMIAPHLATALSAALAPTQESVPPTPSRRRKANLRIVARRDAGEAPPQTG